MARCPNCLLSNSMTSYQVRIILISLKLLILQQINTYIFISIFYDFNEKFPVKCCRRICQWSCQSCILWFRFASILITCSSICINQFLKFLYKKCFSNDEMKNLIQTWSNLVWKITEVMSNFLNKYFIHSTVRSTQKACGECLTP